MTNDTNKPCSSQIARAGPDVRPQVQLRRQLRLQRPGGPLTALAIETSSGAVPRLRTDRGNGDRTMTGPAFLIGIALAIGVGAFASISGFDRDRAFYPTVLIVVGSYYALFAIEGAAPAILALEMGVVLLFVAAAVLGFKTSKWIVVAGLAAHGLFDAVHGHVIANPGTPIWWPAFSRL